MQQRRSLLLTILLILVTSHLYGTVFIFPESPPIDSIEVQINGLFKQIRKVPSDIKRSNLNKKIISLFSQALETDSSFYFPFDSLKYVGKIISPDKRFRLITWNVPMNDGTHQYAGFIQFPDTGKKPVFLDNKDRPDLNEYDIYSNENWYGALYYAIIPDSCSGNYLVLGLDLNNFFTARKVIDVIHFEDHDVVFGAPVFMIDNAKQNRVIFEYSARVSMMLRYEPKKHQIVFDHLSPPDPKLKGQHQFYGPYFSYDGLEQKNCLWELISDIDLKNEIP